jgi:ABC-type antimicrobial peptide transport system permease subunit
VLLTGMAIGLAMAVAARNRLTDILFGVRSDDPWIYGVAIGCLLLAGIVSAIPPVVRALRLEPVAALRYE